MSSIMMEGTGLTQEEIDNFHPIMLQLQKDLLKNSKSSRQLFAEHSDHNIPLHQPEIIAQAVQLIIEDMCKENGHTPLPM